MNNQPPKLPLRFLRWFCDPRLLKYIEGDLLELFEERQANGGLRRARWLFVLDVLKLMKPSLMRKFDNRVWNLGAHIQDQVRSSLRIMRRQKFYTGVILSSMVVALTLIYLLLTFLIKAEEVDSLVTNSDHKYRLLTDNPMDSEKLQTFVMKTQAEYLKDHYPVIKSMTNIYQSEVGQMTVGRDEVNDPIVIGGEKNFLEFFSFDLLSGDVKSAVSPGGIVITRKLAERFFADRNPIGNFIEVVNNDTSLTLQVTGVLELKDYNSHLKFDAIVFEQSLKAKYGGLSSYMEFYDDQDVSALAEQVSADPEMPFLWKSEFSRIVFEPYSQIYYDHEINRQTYIRSISREFVLVGWGVTSMILIISLLNFINLFLLASIKRRKELGVKKVLGGSAWSIYGALASDIMIYLISALGIAFTLSSQLLGQFNYRFESSLVIGDLFNLKVLGLLGGVLLLLMTFAMLYVFGRINKSPMSMLSKSADFKIKINKFILSPQFVVSVILAICSLMILKQIDYIRNKPLGFDGEVLNIGANGERNIQSLRILKHQLLTDGVVNHASLCSGNPLIGSFTIGLKLPDGGRYTPNGFSGDFDYFKTMGMSIKQASNDTLAGRYVNETLVGLFDFENPVGEKIPGDGNLIVGVVHDFNMTNLYLPIPPVIINIDDRESFSNLVVNVKGKDLNKVLMDISERWVKLFPDQPFVYQDLHTELMLRHKDDTRLLNIVTVFALGGIAISCFGLFALSWGIAQNRTKEVGIRKVVGASMLQIITLLSRDYLKWVIFSFAIACPVAYWLTEKWLEHFAYRVSMLPGVFVTVGVATVLLALVIVGFHAAKVARINPVDSLHDE